MKYSSKINLIIIILSVILSACSSTNSEAQIQTAIAETQVAISTNTQVPSPTLTKSPTITLTPTLFFTPTSTISPTTVPLSDLDLDWLFDEEKYMPTGFSRGQIKHTAPLMFRDCPDAAQEIDMRFEKYGEAAGGVTMFLYENPLDAKEAYMAILDSWGDIRFETQYDDNFTYSVFEESTPFMDFTEAVLILCDTAVIHSRITDAIDKAGLTAYLLEYLKIKIEPFVCKD